MDQKKPQASLSREVTKHMKEGEELLAKGAAALGDAASAAEKILVAEERDSAASPQGNDIKASIPRTTAQHTLYVISWIALLFGITDIVTSLISGYAVLMGISPAFSTDITHLGGYLVGGSNQYLLFYGFVIALGMLQMLTGFLGIRAANDAAKVNPFRALCYGIALLLVVVALWAWGNGKIIIFDPMVIITTIVYVGILSNLGERVKSEYDAGISGTTFMRSRYQRVLHFIAVTTIVINVAYFVVYAFLLGAADMSNYVSIPYTTEIRVFVAGIRPLSLLLDTISALFTLLVAAIALRGSNNARYIRPFVIIQFLVTSFNVAALIVSALFLGLSEVQASSVGAIVYNLITLYLGIRIEMGLPDSIVAKVLSHTKKDHTLS